MYTCGLEDTVTVLRVLCAALPHSLGILQVLSAPDGVVFILGSPLNNFSIVFEQGPEQLSLGLLFFLVLLS